MRFKNVRIVAAMLVATAGMPAVAGTMGSALIMSSNGSLLDCFISNVGSRTVVIESTEIRTYQGALVQLSSEHCVGELEPGETCVFTGPTVNGRGVVEVHGSTRGLRGSCQISNSLDYVQATTELR